IDGFKMAEPLILAYGRGILPEFPGAHDGILDVVPVDIVTNALLAIAENPPPAGDPAYYHVGSGWRNPLTFGQLYDLVHEYFSDHPLPVADRGTVLAPEWTFPGARKIERTMRTGERAVAIADKALMHMPSTERTQGWMMKNLRQQQQLEFLRRHADLYGMYTAIEVIYSDDRLLELHRAQTPERQRDAGFDTAVVDWHHYFYDVHFPAVTAVLRRPSGSRTPRPTRKPLPAGENVAAVFDMEGTLLAGNVIESYLWARLSQLPRTRWPVEFASLARSLPRYFAADRRDRVDFLRIFLRRYAGASEAEFVRFVDERLSDLLLRRAAPDAIRQVRRHREAGHHTVLITGTIDQFVAPMATLFDTVVASTLQVKDGVFTGYLEAPPLVGEARAAWLRRFASDHGTDLPASYAYGDSFADRPLLEAVGHPVAVNPDARLFRHARTKHWRVEHWGEHTRGAIETMLEVAK
ncbi:MAG: HAD-IB family hydrolase, partial [Pseudonocardiales bacterium]